jgi:ERCC4-type nuclease
VVPGQGKQAPALVLKRIMKLVDSREPEIIRTALKKTGWEQDTLNSADFGFFTADNRSVGIERKTVPDLINSIMSRLPMQFYRQLEDYEINILMIEGRWGMQLNKIVTSGQMYNITWEAVFNFVRTWQDRGLTIEWSLDTGHTVQRLEELYQYYQKIEHSGGIDRNTSGDSRLIALQCPGIGPKLAAVILAKYGTIQFAANADYVQLAKDIPGLGMKKAMALYNHFRS